MSPGRAGDVLWLKAFHIILMVTWFAGLFYLPRLFVYHAMDVDRAGHERFVTMEFKLFVIMTIGGLGTLATGLGLLLSYAWAAFSETGWLHVKIALVLGLVAFHGYCYTLVLAFRRGNNRHGHRYYRWLNEVPALALLAIVILAVVKPF